MDPHTIRITIELPQGADVQASGGATVDTARGAAVSATSGAIDAGPPPAALVAALGEAATPTTLETMTDPTMGGASNDAINAGAFPAGLATEMEAEGPRHPFGHPETGIAPTISAVLGPESRN
jgi:hypothetical protein